MVIKSQCLRHITGIMKKIRYKIIFAKENENYLKKNDFIIKQIFEMIYVFWSAKMIKVRGCIFFTNLSDFNDMELLGSLSVKNC